MERRNITRFVDWSARRIEKYCSYVGSGCLCLRIWSTPSILSHMERQI